MRQLDWTKLLLVTSLTTSVVLLFVVYNRWEYRPDFAYLGSLLSTATHLTGGDGGGGRMRGGDGVTSSEASLGIREVQDKHRHGLQLARFVERSCLLQLNTDTADGTFHNNFIVVDDKHKLLFCSVPKVASLNWRRVLLVLSGKVDASDPEDIDHSLVFSKYRSLLPTLNQFNESARQHRLRTYFKFMFVRNPFQRLLSAWRNKFVSTIPTSLAFRRRYGPSIVSRYRNASELGPQEHLNGTRADQILVTFIEFLRFLADRAESGKGMNPHWERFDRLCSPCLVHYDFVGEYETLEEDSIQILKKAHVDSLVSFPRRSSLYTHSSTASVMEQYYRDIPTSLLKRLYRIYQRDFQLFDYSVPVDFVHLTPVRAGDKP